MAEAGRSQQKDERQVRSRILKDGLKNDSSCLITDGSSTLTASLLETVTRKSIGYKYVVASAKRVESEVDRRDGL